MRVLKIALAALLFASGGTQVLGQTAAAAPAGGAASTPPATASVTSVLVPQSYVLGPKDVVGVAVVGRNDYSTQAQVQDDGTITLPLIGSLSAANLTLLQLKAIVEQKLKSGGYFVRPDVAVVLVNAASQYAVLLGDVGTAGLVPLDRNYRLSELIARGAGVKPGADAVTVTSAAGEARDYSLRSIATGGSPDPVITPGTKVFVHPAQMFYVYGQVGTAGSFPLEAGMTVRRAIARAGGTGQLGSLRKVTLYRGDKEIRKVNLNMQLEPNDTIHVGERFF